MSGLKRMLRRPAPRVFAPRSILELRMATSDPVSKSDVSTFSAIEVTDAILMLANRQSMSDSYELAPVNESVSVPQLFNRLSELTADMDPVLVARAISGSARLDYGIDSLAPTFIARCGDMQLGCFSRSLVALSKSCGSQELYEAAVLRAKSLLEERQKVVPRVLSKLCCGFGHLRRFGVDEFLWDKLEALTMLAASDFDAGQLGQVAFAFSVVNRSAVSEALFKRGIELSPIRPLETYMNLLVALSRLSDKQGESWEMFERIARDSLGIRKGYIPVPVLRKAFASGNYACTDAQFKRVLSAFKPEPNHSSFKPDS